MNPSPFPDYNRPDPTMLDVLADFGLLAGGVGCIVFVLLYGFFLNWRKTAAGRAIFYFMLSVVSVVGLNILARITGGDYPFRDWLRLTVYLGVCVTSWRLVATLVRAWLGGERALNLPARERGRKRRTASHKENP